MINLFIIIMGLTFFSNDKVKDAKVDVKASTIDWIGKKVLGMHNGTIQFQNGRLEIDDEGNLTGGFFTVDMTTISNSDLSGDYKEKLENHLKSEDFFDIEKYPTATFLITRSVFQGQEKYKVIGDLTIKGITNEIRFPVDLSIKNGKIKALAILSIDRSRYNIRYGSGSFFDNLGDKTIHDNFDMSISIVANM